MDRSSRDRRHYKATPLPTLREEVDVSQNRDLLLEKVAKIVPYAPPLFSQ